MIKFPEGSGKWNGTYEHDGTNYPMGCILAFIQGRIEGGGIDNNGAFSIRGPMKTTAPSP